jgi:acetate---CoA ligase (ADP-forming)
LLAHQPIPAGARLAVLSNAGGPAILAADACEGHGLQLADLSDATVRRLRLLLPAAASVSNPVDMLASATPEHYRCATKLLLADEHVDSLLVIFIPPLVTQATEVATAISSGSALTTKPVIATFMGSQNVRDELGRIPSYRYPESAVAALARVTSYGAWRRRPRGSIKQFADIRPDTIRRVIDGALARGHGWLTPMEATTLAEGAGLSIASTLLAATADEAVSAGRQFGYPVALKAVGPEIVHKTEVGGVILDIADESSLYDAFSALKARLGDTMTSALVQQMVPGGVELLVGALVDPVFGPLVACGSGGVLVDLLADTTFRLNPLTDVEAAEMIASLKSTALLRGYRGQSPCDAGAAVDALLRVSLLLDLCPEIQELELNPLKVLSQGARAVDIRVRVGHSPARAGSRRISY